MSHPKASSQAKQASKAKEKEKSARENRWAPVSWQALGWLPAVLISGGAAKPAGRIH